MFRYMLVTHASSRPNRVASGWQRIEGRLNDWLGEDLNPLAHSGRFAVLSLAIALVSGAYLFFFYDVAAPYESVLHQSDNVLGVAFRGLHRYASRAMILFTVIHAVRLGLAGRFSGPRWLAWTSGVTHLLIIWFVGLTGYLIIWDQQAYLLTLGLVRLIDSTPLFVQPFSLSFLTAETVRDNLFFVTLYVHISVPVAGAGLLWIHVSRLRRPQLTLSRRAVAGALFTLLVLAFVRQVQVDPEANVSRLPHLASIDPWFSFGAVPALTVSPAAFGLLSAVPAAVASALPWLGRRKPVRAVIDPLRCNQCYICTIDCPYGAISMVPIESLGMPKRARVAEVAKVDLGRCVGCGICLGSCTLSAIALGERSLDSLKDEVDAVLTGPTDQTILVVTCQSSAPPRANSDTVYVEVPCVGDVNRNLVGHALRRGVAGVLVAGCPPNLCRYREGARWTTERASRSRRPGWLPQFGRRSAVAYVVPGDSQGLAAAVGRLRETARGGGPSSPFGRPAAARIAASALLALGIAALLGSDLPAYAQLANAGMVKLAVRTDAPLREQRLLLDTERRLPVSRTTDLILSRERVPIILTLAIDGRQAVREVLEARGLRHDGPTYAYEEILLEPGTHHFRVVLESADENVPYHHEWEDTRQIGSGDVLVLSFGAIGEGFVTR